MTGLVGCSSERTKALQAVLTESELDDLSIQIAQTPECQWENFNPYLRKHSYTINLLHNQHIFSLNQTIQRLESKLVNARILLQRKCIGYLYERIMRFSDTLEGVVEMDEDAQMPFGSIMGKFSKEIALFSVMNLTLDSSQWLLLTTCQYDSIKKIFQLRLKSNPVLQPPKPLKQAFPLNVSSTKYSVSRFSYFLERSTVISRKKSEQTLILSALLIESELSDMEQHASSSFHCRWGDCFPRLTEISLNINKLSHYPIAALQMRILRVGECFNKTHALVAGKCVRSLSIRLFRLYDNLRETQASILVAKQDKILHIFQGFTAEIDGFSDVALTWEAKISLATAKSVLSFVKMSFDARIHSHETSRAATYSPFGSSSIRPLA